jgi:hypothetical protein
MRLRRVVAAAACFGEEKGNGIIFGVSVKGVVLGGLEA